MNRVWQAVARYDRRGHQLRCRACWRIITAGTPALFLRRRHGVWAVHADCAEHRHSEAYTWREVFHVWGDP